MPYRWRIVALLFILAVINYLDRQSLAVLAPTLQHKLGFSAVQYSYVVTLFLIAYTIGFLFCGAVVDRMGVRFALTAALAVWSLAGILHAFATTWIALAACRFLLGLGESFNSPCAVKAVGEWIPQRERGLCMAIVSNGNIVGAILAPPFVAYISLRFGWQWAFVATGALGLPFLIMWLAAYHAPEVHPALRPAERKHILMGRAAPSAAARVSLTDALRNPLCRGFMIARLLTDSLSFFIIFWLPQYLQAARGYSLAMVGFFSWIPFLASDVGGPGGGALSDWLVRRGWTPLAARKRMLLMAACLMPVSLVAVRVGSAAWALGLIALLLAAQSCWFSNLLTMMSEVFPREHLATYVSVASVGGSVGGIISTLLAGQIISSVGYVPVFTGLGLLHLTAFGVILHFLRRHRQNTAISVSS